jgi:hypothetical protein
MDKSFYIKSNEALTVKSSHRESYSILNKLNQSNTVVYEQNQLDKLLKLPYLLGFDFNSKIFLFSTYQKNFKAYHNKVDLNVLYQHFSKRGILSLNPYSNSKILLIDIDHQNQYINKHRRKSTRFIVDKIVQEFGLPFYIERNEKNYHIYIQTNTLITSRLARNIERYFVDKFQYVIEVIDPSKTLRLPASKKYSKSYGIYSKLSPCRIREYHKKNSLVDIISLLKKDLHLFEHYQIHIKNYLKVIPLYE